tara:strand:- start:34074 stop:34556 length:483 start_codon:yes stop_codon:yes gene_type:complete
MSKRYGRNQKRAAKIEIARLHEEVRQLKIRGSLNETIVEDTSLILGNNFVSLPPEDFEIVNPYLLECGLEMHSPMFAHTPMADKQKTVMKFLRLPIMHSDNKFIDNLRNQMHFRIKYEGEQVGYSMSRETMDLMPKHVAHRKIAEQMTQVLLNSKTQELN